MAIFFHCRSLLSPSSMYRSMTFSLLWKKKSDFSTAMIMINKIWAQWMGQKKICHNWTIYEQNQKKQEKQQRKKENKTKRIPRIFLIYVMGAFLIHFISFLFFVFLFFLFDSGHFSFFSLFDSYFHSCDQNNEILLASFFFVIIIIYLFNCQ